MARRCIASSRSSSDDDTLDRRDVRSAEASAFRTSCARSCGYNIRAVVATEPAMLERALERYYGDAPKASRASSRRWRDDAELAAAAAMVAGRADRPRPASRPWPTSAPVRKLLNMVLLLAIKDHASDLHFEPFEDEFQIRIKADGVLYEMVPPPRHLAFAITTRIKVMANLDIAERRLPQDGRIELTVGGHPVDLRVSRAADHVRRERRHAGARSLGRHRSICNTVGMDADTLADVPRSRSASRTASCWSPGRPVPARPPRSTPPLNELNDINDKLITTEDPVEYDIDGIVQVPIDASIGNTFATCLRAILRQDPDKILVGEIRDLETAEIAVQASLTGHMVFSTLHTNDAPSTITRLKDMGVQPFLITATVEAILAQRLVRRVCTQCREEHRPSDGNARPIWSCRRPTSWAKRFFRGPGCESCNNTGYKGRVGLFELMIMNNELRELDHAATPRPTISARPPARPA